ncbi:hypothetical protein NYE37_03965 [Thermoactinomyces sp. FSL K6-2592]|jgi:hypothetical protein|uniref:hypothetical protein n=1 Tax=Thermoactinomyces TaxID=2023 RepID=UPI0030F4E156
MSKGNIKKVAINFKLDDKQEGDMWEYLNKVSTNHSAYFKRLLYMEMRLNPDGKGGYPVAAVPAQPLPQQEEPEPEEEKPNFDKDDLGGIFG